MNRTLPPAGARHRQALLCIHADLMPAEWVTHAASRGRTPHISGTSTPSWPAGLARADLDDMAAAYELGPLDTASQLAQAARSLCMQSTAGQKSVWDQIAELSRTGPGEQRLCA